MSRPLRVISANIRKADADDGSDAWIHRRQWCGQLLAQQDPDLLGLQEARQQQVTDLRQALPGLDWYGLPRTPADGHPVNAIGWRRDRFVLRHAGGFWLSETPQQSDGTAWGAGSIRLFNWAWLHDHLTGSDLRFGNTHLDHLSATARSRGLQLILDEAATWPAALPQILSMDANARSTDPELAARIPAGWQDAWLTSGTAEPRCTYHAFAGPDGPEAGGRIDHIWYRGPLRTEAVACLDHADPTTGRWPSDHAFIQADLIVTEIGPSRLLTE